MDDARHTVRRRYCDTAQIPAHLVGLRLTLRTVFGDAAYPDTIGLLQNMIEKYW